MAVVVVVLAEDGARQRRGDGRAIGVHVAKDAGRLVGQRRAGHVEAAVRRGVHGGVGIEDARSTGAVGGGEVDDGRRAAVGGCGCFVSKNLRSRFGGV